MKWVLINMNFLFQLSSKRNVALNNDNTKCEEIGRAFQEMDINNCRPFSPNKMTKKCVLI